MDDIDYSQCRVVYSSINGDPLAPKILHIVDKNNKHVRGCALVGPQGKLFCCVASHVLDAMSIKWIETHPLQPNERLFVDPGFLKQYLAEHDIDFPPWNI